MTGDRGEAQPPRHSDRRSRTRPVRRRPPAPRAVSVERRRALLNRFTLIFGVIVGVSAIVAALLARTDDGSETELTAGPTAPSEAVAVRVLEVIDGDTIRVEAVGGEVLTVRLFGVDTPERGESCYDEAASRLRRLAGETVLLLAAGRLQDPGGRELRYVFTETGASIDAALLAEGLAVAWRLDGAFRDELVGLEEAARAAGAGCLWAS